MSPACPWCLGKAFGVSWTGAYEAGGAELLAARARQVEVLPQQVDAHFRARGAADAEPALGEVELLNGRAAMLGFMAAIVVERITGYGIVGQLTGVVRWYLDLG